MLRVLIADRVDPISVEAFESRGLAVDYQPELADAGAELRDAVAGYNGLAVRSGVRVTREVLDRADMLQVVGRAGVGVDTIDVAAATERGIAVMNTPYGNTVTTAEHTIAMMLALMRHIPQADAALRAGRWERGGYLGVELAGKTLGVLGCGHVGAAVASRAAAFGMRVVAYDPFLPQERAAALGVARIDSLSELLAQSDVVTVHVPLTEATRDLLSRERIAQIKSGARLINCARGGIVDEAALHAALVEGRLSGAALDVYASEPAIDHPIFALPNVVVTPHLGASTAEAQRNVARQIAIQMSEYLLEGTVVNAVNMPSLSAAELAHLRPWMSVAEMLGAFAGQLTESSITELTIEYVGSAADRNRKALSAALIAALLRPTLGEGVNMISAPDIARARGVRVSESVLDARGAFGAYVRLIVSTERQTRSVAGTVFSDRRPRIIQIKGVDLEATPQPHMIYATNVDQPGFIGALGTALGESGVNIATFALGRAERGGEAITLLGVDAPPSEAVLDRIRGLPLVKQVKVVNFS